MNITLNGLLLIDEIVTKWRRYGLLKGIEGDVARHTAYLLENQYVYNRMDEVADQFHRFIIPVLRCMFPRLKCKIPVVSEMLSPAPHKSKRLQSRFQFENPSTDLNGSLEAEAEYCSFFVEVLVEEITVWINAMPDTVKLVKLYYVDQTPAALDINSFVPIRRLRLWYEALS